MLLVVLLVGGLGATGSYLGFRQAQEAQRIGVMLEQLHRLHAVVHELLEKGMSAAVVLDPEGWEHLDDLVARQDTSVSRLVAQAVGEVESHEVIFLAERAGRIRNDLERLFRGTEQERERQRLTMLAVDYRDGIVGGFDRRVAALTDHLGSSAERLHARLLDATQLAAWLSPVLVGVALALVWFTRGNLRRQVDEPVSQLREGVERVASGELEHRVPADGALELAGLADGLNHMADELARQREALVTREREVALGRLVPVVAHNIRNPLASIRAASQLVDGASADERDQIARDIISSVDRLERWTRTLLDYLNPARPEPQPLPLRRPVDEALEATRYRIDQKRLEVEIEDRLPGLVVDVDPDLVEQALHGLLVNAVEASPVGGRIALAIENDGNGACLRIDDQGPGIDFIPEPSELRPGPSSKRYGTGLGIPFAYKVCGVHGWHLAFATLPGGGTRVIIRLQPAKGRNDHE